MHRPGQFAQLFSLKPDEGEQLLSDLAVPMVFISRNPYVRLLSGYLEKIAKARSMNRINIVEPYNGKDPRVLAKLRGLTVDTFDSFVHKLYAVF